MFQVNWNDMDSRMYIEEAGRTNAYWLGNIIGADEQGNKIRRFPVDFIIGIFHVTQTRARTCSIRSVGEWINFVDCCYSLGCRNCGEQGWTAINGVKDTFREWMQTNSTRNNNAEFFSFDENQFSDRTFVTVFDTKKQRRLMVDGLHRANALTIACERGIQSIPQVTVVECYGNRVDILYPCDIHQLPS